MLVGLLIVVDFPVMFLSSKDERPMDMPYTQRSFSQLASLAQQLHSLGPLIVRAVQAASVRMSYSLSISGPVGEAIPGKFNFGVGTGGG